MLIFKSLVIDACHAAFWQIIIIIIIIIITPTISNAPYMIVFTTARRASAIWTSLVYSAECQSVILKYSDQRLRMPDGHTCYQSLNGITRV